MYVIQVLRCCIPWSSSQFFPRKLQTASVGDMDDPLKLLSQNLEELKLRGVEEERFYLDDDTDIDFGVSLTESSSDKKNLSRFL